MDSVLVTVSYISHREHGDQGKTCICMGHLYKEAVDEIESFEPLSLYCTVPALTQYNVHLPQQVCLIHFEIKKQKIRQSSV